MIRAERKICYDTAKKDAKNQKANKLFVSQQMLYCYNAIYATLRSATNNEMLVPCSRLKFGKRAFSIAAPKAWNSLPNRFTRHSEHWNIKK